MGFEPGKKGDVPAPAVGKVAEASPDVAPDLPVEKGGASMLKDVFSKVRDFAADKSVLEESRTRRKSASKAPKRKGASKPKKKPTFDVEEAADALLESSTGVKLKPNGGVDISLDLKKIPRGSSGKRLGYEDVVPPGIKGFKLDIKAAADISPKSVVAYRKPVKSGDLGFYYKGEDGKERPLKLDLDGEVTIKIEPSDYEDLSPSALQDLLEKQAASAAEKQLATSKTRKTVATAAKDLADDIFGPTPVSSGRRSTARRASRGRSPRSYTDGSPAARPRTSPRRGPYVPGAPVEVARTVKGNVETVRIGKYKVKVTRDPATNEILQIASGDRKLNHPVSSEAAEIFKQMRPDEPFVRTKDPIRPGRDIVLRKTAYMLYLKANELSMKDGYAISCGSTWRGAASQRGIYAKSSDPGRLAAAPGKSHHHRGSTIDAKAYHYAPGASNHLKPLPKNKSYAVLKKYMAMAGFVNYTVEGWHHESFNPRWAAMMVAAGYLPEGTDPQDFSNPRLLHGSELAYVDPPRTLMIA